MKGFQHGKGKKSRQEAHQGRWNQVREGARIGQVEVHEEFGVRTRPEEEPEA